MYLVSLQLSLIQVVLSPISSSTGPQKTKVVRRRAVVTAIGPSFWGCCDCHLLTCNGLAE